MDNNVQNYINLINTSNRNIISEEVFLTDRNELRFKNNKSPDLDILQTVVMKKNASPIIFAFLAKVFNFCLLNGYFPKIFKKAKIIYITE